MVERELLVQEALRNKLEQSPKPQARLRAARRRVPVQAKIDSLTEKAEILADADIQRHFHVHPELFSE